MPQNGPGPIRETSIVGDLRVQVRRLWTVSRHRVYPYTKSGAISATSTGTIRHYNDSGYDRNITAVRASLGTVATTTSVIVDVKMNGTTLYTTTANRPTLTTGTASVLATLPDIITWTAGSYLTVDVTQADVAAANLTVQITAV